VSFWAAVFTQPYAEPIAVREIERAGHGTFLPFFKIGKWRGSELQIRDRPLLPGYVFVSLPDGAAWSSINHADGVARVLVAGHGTPVRVTPVMSTTAVASDHKTLAPSNKRNPPAAANRVLARPGG
jgi:transcriptional antiterminator RfaH